MWSQKRQELVNLSGEPPSSLGSALLVLGCPQVPVQTSIALYLINRLKRAGIVPVVPATNRQIRFLSSRIPTVTTWVR